MIDLEISVDDGTALVKVNQNLEAIDSADLHSALGRVLAAGESRIAIDLSKVAKISTAGFGLIYTLNGRVEDAGKHIAFVATGQLAERIKNLDAGNRMTICESVNKASLLLRSRSVKAGGKRK